MSGLLAGRVALVAGGGRGIGRAIALAFADEGARLVLLARTQTEIDAAAVECGAHGAPEARGVVADVRDWLQVCAAVDEVIAVEGTLDVLVISSGTYGPIAPIADVDPAGWADAVAVDLLGPLHLMRAAFPHMIRRRSGRVLVLAGGGATLPMPSFSAYAAAKAGLVRLVETAALEVGGAGLRVNAIAPGLVDTGLQDTALAAGTAAGIIGERLRAARERGEGTVGAEVAARLAVFLASDVGEAINGKLISAPHDDWRAWPARRAALDGSDWFTLRRIDPYTIGQLPAERR